MSGSVETCATCGYWSSDLPAVATGFRRPAGSDPEVGSCHASAPWICEREGGLVTVFPATHARQFCGEWTPAGDGTHDGAKVVDTTNVVSADFGRVA